MRNGASGWRWVCLTRLNDPGKNERASPASGPRKRRQPLQPMRWILRIRASLNGMNENEHSALRPGATQARPNILRRLTSRGQTTRYVFSFAVFFLLLLARRSEQLLRPQVWGEDGTEVLRGLIDHGVVSLAYPVSGFLIIVSKLIDALSLSISGLYFPFISTFINWVFICLVCMAISYCPT